MSFEAESNSGGVQAASPAAEVTDFALTLDEYCTRLSGRDNRVELIGAFYAYEVRNGHVSDVESAFESRYVAFADMPSA